MPLGPIFDAEKKNLLAGPPKKTASNFCDLFQFTLSLIFTRPAAIWPFFVVFCFSIHTVHTVNSPNQPPPNHGVGRGGSITQNDQKESFSYRHLEKTVFWDQLNGLGTS